jgi:ubiquinone biosynthesis protein
MLNPFVLPRDLGRLHALASILVRHGFADLVQRLGIARALARAGQALPSMRAEAPPEIPAPVRVRHALEEMGPCFVKLGQLLATRVDLFPSAWIAEFSRLQNAVPPVPFTELQPEMEAALGAPLQAAFAAIDIEPLAAGSIAQVHRARLLDGGDVVVKVRRPGIRHAIEADLRLLEGIARRLERRFPDLARYHPSGMVVQFRASLLRELDLAAECHNAERIAAAFADDPRLAVPAVHWVLTSERMNVQAFVDGIGVIDVAALDAAGMDRRGIARDGAQLVLKMLLRDGYFHADPHPGNVFVLADGRIALIDFGMVGRLSQARRVEVVRLLSGLVERDAAQVTEVLLDWADTPDADEDGLAGDIDAFVDRYHGIPLGELDLSRMLLDVIALLQAHRLALPADLALMIKVCLTLEGLGRTLDPGFDMAMQARPFLRRAMVRELGPRALARRGVHALADATRVLAGLPADLRRLQRTLRAGGARVHVRLDELEGFSRQLGHSANRLAGSLVIAALIIGSSIAMTVEGGPTWMGLPFFGLLGFVGASVAGLWLLWTIFRTGGGR